MFPENHHIHRGDLNETRRQNHSILAIQISPLCVQATDILIYLPRTIVAFHIEQTVATPVKNISAARTSFLYNFFKEFPKYSYIFINASYCSSVHVANLALITLRQ